MLHRFRHDDLGVAGHDPSILRQSLEYLRRHRYEIVDVRELVMRLMREDRPLDRAVAFTMDDGYRDQAEVAAPLFAAYDCPVTTFVTTGFLDGLLWLWWDQVEFIFAHVDRPQLTVCLDGTELRYACGNADQQHRAAADFSARCKAVSNSVMREALAELATAAGVDLPTHPPKEYAPMTWGQVRDCEARGMTFGPHSVSHPIMSRTSKGQSRNEIVESRERLSRSAACPLPVFCYPNGQLGDFGSREIDFLRGEGFLGAFSAVSGYAVAAQIQREPRSRFSISRFSYPDSLTDLIQVVSGVERFKQMIRREA